MGTKEKKEKTNKFLSLDPKSMSFHRVILIHKESQLLSSIAYVFVLRSCIILVDTTPTNTRQIKIWFKWNYIKCALKGLIKH
jgi:hypothetical protein